jgi:TRAP-type mannitol/chloroaromatic compound transport system permease small subunit
MNDIDDGIKGASIVLGVVGAFLSLLAVLLWWVSLPELWDAGVTRTRSCLFAPCTPRHSHIPTLFWIGVVPAVLGITSLLALVRSDGPSRGLLMTVRWIDWGTDLTGTVFSWISIPLMGSVAYEVIARYAFSAPTIWSFDMTYMLYAALFMLGAAYALHKGAHIRTDFFWENFTPRTKGVIDSIAYIVFFFPSLIALGIVGYVWAKYAWDNTETSEQTPWRPVLWPFRFIVPAACGLLIVQGYSELLKSLYMARTGVELEHKEKVEV